VTRDAALGFVPSTLGATRRASEHADNLSRLEAFDKWSHERPAPEPPSLETLNTATHHAPRHPSAESPTPVAPDGALAGIVELTDAEVASFKELGAEVTLRTSDGDEVVLVPEPTVAKDRVELSVDSLRVITRMCEIFKVTNVRCEPVAANEQLDIRMNPEAREVRAGGLPSDPDEA